MRRCACPCSPSFAFWRAVFYIALFSANHVAQAANCTAGVQTSIGYPDVTAVCAAQWSAYTYGSPNAPSGNEGNTYDHYYLTATGETNLKPILLFVHGGGFMVTQATETYPQYARLMAQFARDGFDVYHPTYTVLNFFQVQAQVNSGDTNASIKWANFALINPASGFCSSTTGWTMPVDGGTANADVWTITGITGNLCDGAAHTITITRSASSTTHANGAYAWTTGLGLPAVEGDMAGFLSFLATCSTGGLSPLAGACSSYTHVPGDPNQIRYWGISAGGQLGALMILKGSCWKGSTCTLMNITPGTPGGHEWSATGWTIQNPHWTVPMVFASMASNTGEAYAQNQILGGSQATDTTSTAAIMLTGTGTNPGVPSCPGGAGGFNMATLVCASPTATYTASLLQSPLAIINAGTSFGPGGPFALEQSGGQDTDFNVYEPLVGAKPGFLAHNYPLLSHGLDYLSVGLGGVAMAEARAVFGVNPCAAIVTSGDQCPAPNPINGGGVY